MFFFLCCPLFCENSCREPSLYMHITSAFAAIKTLKPQTGLELILVLWAPSNSALFNKTGSIRLCKQGHFCETRSCTRLDWYLFARSISFNSIYNFQLIGFSSMIRPSAKLITVHCKWAVHSNIYTLYGFLFFYSSSWICWLTEKWFSRPKFHKHRFIDDCHWPTKGNTIL